MNYMVQTEVSESLNIFETVNLSDRQKLST